MLSPVSNWIVRQLLMKKSKIKNGIYMLKKYINIGSLLHINRENFTFSANVN